MTGRHIDSLVNVINAARPKLSNRDQHIALALYQLLGEGKPVTFHQLGALTGESEIALKARLDGWPGALRDDHGHITGLWGLSVIQISPHRMLLAGQELWAWCAWDTLFLPRRLGSAIDVSSRCPATGRDIKVRVSPTSVESAEPAHLSMSFVKPDGPFGADAISTFCCHVHFFADMSKGQEWVDHRPGTFLVSLEEAFAIARLADEMFLPEVTKVARLAEHAK